MRPPPPPSHPPLNRNEFLIFLFPKFHFFSCVLSDRPLVTVTNLKYPFLLPLASFFFFFLLSLAHSLAPSLFFCRALWLPGSTCPSTTTLSLPCLIPSIGPPTMVPRLNRWAKKKGMTKSLLAHVTHSSTFHAFTLAALAILALLPLLLLSLDTFSLPQSCLHRFFLPLLTHLV